MAQSSEKDYVILPIFFTSKVNEVKKFMTVKYVTFLKDKIIESRNIIEDDEIDKLRLELFFNKKFQK